MCAAQTRLDRIKQWRDALIEGVTRSESLVEWLRANIALIVECETEIALLEFAAQLERDGMEPCKARQAAACEMIRGLLVPPSHEVVANCLDTLQRDAILRLSRKTQLDTLR